jgi:hypothetical protein
MSRQPLGLSANHCTTGAKEGVWVQITAAFTTLFFVKEAAEAAPQGETSPTKLLISLILVENAHYRCCSPGILSPSFPGAAFAVLFLSAERIQLMRALVS